MQRAFVERCSPGVCETGRCWGGTLFALWFVELGGVGVERCSPDGCGTGRGWNVRLVFVELGGGGGGTGRCSPGVCGSGRGGWNVVRLVFVELGGVGRTLFAWCLWNWEGWVERCSPGVCGTGRGGWNVVRLVFVELGGGGVERPVNHFFILYFTPSQVGGFFGGCFFTRCEPGRL